MEYRGVVSRDYISIFKIAWGSVLGSYLFPIFVNDISKNNAFSKVSSWVEDNVKLLLGSLLY